MSCKGCERMAKVEQILYGNGGPGLARKVEELNVLLNQLRGMVRALKILLPIIATLTGIPLIQKAIELIGKIF